MEMTPEQEAEVRRRILDVLKGPDDPSSFAAVWEEVNDPRLDPNDVLLVLKQMVGDGIVQTLQAELYFCLA